MAAKTNEEIGAKIRTAISNFDLNANEEVQDIKIIIVGTVKNTDNQAVYRKGGAGVDLKKYNETDEEMTDAW